MKRRKESKGGRGCWEHSPGLGVAVLKIETNRAPQTWPTLAVQPFRDHPYYSLPGHSPVTTTFNFRFP